MTESSSDRRIKEDIVDLADGLTKIAALQPRQFKFIDDPTTPYAGFIAQEYVGTFPEYTLVNGDDGVVPLGSNFPWQIDMEPLTPYLVAAIKELLARVEALENP